MTNHIAPVVTCLTLAVASCVTTEVHKPAPLVNYTPTVLSQKSSDQLKQEIKGFFTKADLVRRAPYRGADITWYSGEWVVASFEPDGVFIKFKNAAPNYAYHPNNPDPSHTYSFYYDELASIAFNAGSCDTKNAPLPHGMTLQFYPIHPPVGPEVCNTLFSLGQHYRLQREKDAAAFAEQAARYRALTVKPVLSEEQRRLVVQAEHLRERKDYAGAADLLRTAVRQNPVSYPAAYFNLALLYEQQEQFARAIDAMKKYLLLQPGAADARAAQDKIYQWELQAGER